jgi:Ala-tRNA(Pro) deacylase
MTLESFLQQQNVKFEKHAHPTAYTAQQLAEAEHVSGYLVAKPVVVKGRAQFAMCVLAAPHRLDVAKAARALGEPEVRLATEEEMAKLFPGCEIGAEPAIGAMFNMKTVMDSGLQRDAYLIMQAGTHRDSIRIARTDWERLCQPIVAPIAQA